MVWNSGTTRNRKASLAEIIGTLQGDDYQGEFLNFVKKIQRLEMKTRLYFFEVKTAILVR